MVRCCSCVSGSQDRSHGARWLLHPRVASPIQIKRALLSDAARLITVGVTIGVITSMILARFVGSLLFQVEARDPWLYGSVVGIFVAVGLLAAFIPARRASRVDPVVVLRG